MRAGRNATDAQLYGAYSLLRPMFLVSYRTLARSAPTPRAPLFFTGRRHKLEPTLAKTLCYHSSQRGISGDICATSVNQSYQAGAQLLFVARQRGRAALIASARREAIWQGAPAQRTTVVTATPGHLRRWRQIHRADPRRVRRRTPDVRIRPQLSVRGFSARWRLTGRIPRRTCGDAYRSI